MNKQNTLENIMFDNIRESSRYVMENNKHLEFIIPDIKIKRIDNSEVRDKIMLIDPEKRKELMIYKSTIWYQQKKIKREKTIKLYGKIELRYYG
jgi:hypothetical protein